MTVPKDANRRTVLKTIGTGIVGSTVLTGSASAGHGMARGQRNRLEIVGKHDHDEDEHRFELSTNEISSGWTTLRFANRTDHTHFGFLVKLPSAAIEAANEEGEDPLDYYIEHVLNPFQWFMDDLVPEKEPDPDDLSDKYSDLTEEIIFPPWFEGLTASGGAGLTAGSRTSMTTVDLDPGKYIVECYVKNGDEDFHSYLGMRDLLTVTEDRSGACEPRATLDLSLSTAGIDVKEAVRPGRHTVAVRVEDQQRYGNLVGHDVHLIRFDEETDAADVNGWMSWMEPGQLVSNGTEPRTFVGGVQDIFTPELLDGNGSETAYVHVNLKPGSYAWVSEVPNPEEKGLLKTFTVPFDRD